MDFLNTWIQEIITSVAIATIIELILPNGNNKKCLDHIIVVGMKSYRNSAGTKAFSKEYLKSYMQVMFNAGVTVVLRI